MAPNNLRATKAALRIAISCPRDKGIAEVSALFTKIVLSVPYHNEAGGGHEIWCDCRPNNVASRVTLAGSGWTRSLHSTLDLAFRGKLSYLDPAPPCHSESRRGD
jgi:hypothetical protein